MGAATVLTHYIRQVDVLDWIVFLLTAASSGTTQPRGTRTELAQ
jgi:hypothetical protein